MFISLMFNMGILCVIAFAICAAVLWYGKRQHDDAAQDANTPEEIARALTPRNLTAKEMHDATLKGSLEKIRIPVR